MKTTLDLPDELMRAIKVKAAQEDRTMKGLVEELLRRALDAPPETPVKRTRLEFPLIRGTHPAAPGQELTPERIKEILHDEEVERALRPLNN